MLSLTSNFNFNIPWIDLPSMCLRWRFKWCDRQSVPCALLQQLSDPGPVSLCLRYHARRLLKDTATPLDPRPIGNLFGLVTRRVHDVFLAPGAGARTKENVLLL